MKILKGIGILVIAVIAFVLIAGLFVSKKYHYEKSIAIKASQEVVWAHVSNLENFDKWSPYKEYDTAAVMKYTGVGGTVGSTMSWKGNKDVGEGMETISGLTPMSKVDIKLNFKEPFESEAQAFINLVQGKDGVEVTWGFDSESPYPFNTMSLFFNMDEMFDKDYSNGLGKLKAVCEAAAPIPPAI
jgi:hypothetical protein